MFKNFLQHAENSYSEILVKAEVFILAFCSSRWDFKSNIKCYGIGNSITTADGALRMTKWAASATPAVEAPEEGIGAPNSLPPCIQGC